MPAKIAPSELRKTISFHVANLSAEDAVFLSSLIATFCDPNQNINAEAVRRGLAYVGYGWRGKMQIVHRHDRFNGN